MKAFFESLTGLNINTRAYEEKVSHAVTNGIVEKYEKEFIAFLKANKGEKDLLFSAFFALFTLYRRKHDLSKIDNLIENYKNLFLDYPLLAHVELLAEKMSLVKPRDYDSLLQKSYKLTQKEEFKNHAGILHFYSELVASYYELESMSALEFKNDIEAQENLKRAKEYMGICLTNSSKYAKFHFTDGRIKLLLGEYDEAIQSLTRAKIKENPNRSDYSLVVGGYQDYILLSKQLKTTEKINEKNNEIEEQMRNLNANNIKIVSMFTALITLVIGNVNVASNSTEPLKVMFMLNGMFVVFLGIIIMITNLISKPKNPKTIWVISIILTLIGFGMLLLFYFKEIF